MTRRSRMLTALAALLLAAVYVLPLWRIELQAPQYPEGLGLRIWLDRITGEKPQDLDSINNLNHYIGMHRIIPSDIPELRYMPWIVAAMIGGGLLAAALGKRRALYGWVAVLAAGALAGLADFWKWGYDYGHHLSADAIIRIPGMSYQPPLVGGKQLLNFHAYSWPAAGGLLAIAAVALAAAVAVGEWRRARRLARAAGAAAHSQAVSPTERRTAAADRPQQTGQPA
jgi:copper chaperone NosL